MATTTKKLVPGVDYPGSNVNPALSTPLPPGQPQSVPQAPIQPPTDPSEPVLINQSTNPTFVDRNTALINANRAAQTQQDNQLLQQFNNQMMTAEQFKKLSDLTIPATTQNQLTGQQTGTQLAGLPQAQPIGNILNEGQINPVIAGGLGSAAQEAGVVGGAAAGAAIGTAVFPGVGTVAGAGIGAIIGAIVKGSVTSLKSQTENNIAANYQSLQTDTRNLMKLVIDAKKDPVGASQAFQNQLNAIDKHYVNIKSQSQSSVKDFLHIDTQVEMNKFNDFYSDGGMRSILVDRMNRVMHDPNTNVNDLILSSGALE